MATLITGGAGYIGSHIAWLLTILGEKVVVFDNRTSFPSAPPGVIWIRKDVADPRSSALHTAMEKHKIDSVIHMAGLISVPESWKKTKQYRHVNVGGTKNVIAAMKQVGVRNLIFSSSAAVYGNPLSSKVSESHPLNPLSPYGEQKAEAEKLITAAVADISSVSLRYFNVAGADPAMRTGQPNLFASSVLDVLYRCAESREPFTLYGNDYDTSDGSPSRDFIHVWDLAQAHVDALKYLRSGGSSLIANAGYGKSFTVLEAVKAVQQVTGVDFPVVNASRADGDIGVSLSDNALIRDVLSWSYEHDNLSVMVQTAWRWRQSLKGKG